MTKILDRKDIEKLGWTFVKPFVNKYFPYEDYMIEVKTDMITYKFYLRRRYKAKSAYVYNGLSIATDDLQRTPDIDGNWKKKQIFEGTIKYKSELKTLMKWLGIN